MMAIGYMCNGTKNGYFQSCLNWQLLFIAVHVEKVVAQLEMTIFISYGALIILKIFLKKNHPF